MPVWVDPGHLVETARYVAEGHALSRLAVIRPGFVSGYVTRQQLLASDPKSRVEELANPIPQLSVHAPDGDLIQLFESDDVDCVALVDGAQFLGLVTPKMLLRVQPESFDSVTGLPWSHTLRNWAIRTLQAEKELTVLTLDIDHFDSYNKRLGFEVGDLLLRETANALSSVIELDLEVLARSSGDEFSIATVRNQASTVEFVRNLYEAYQAISDPKLQPIPAISIGVSGGRRSPDRGPAHFPSMVDNLLKISRADAVSHFQEKTRDYQTIPDGTTNHGEGSATPIEPAPATAPVPQPAPSVPPRLETKIISVADWPQADVAAVINGKLVNGTASVDTDRPLRSIALATGRAIEIAHPGLMVEVNDVNVFEEPDGSRLASIFGRIVFGSRSLPLAGSAKVIGSPSEAVAQAILSGFLVNEIRESL